MKKQKTGLVKTNAQDFHPVKAQIHFQCIFRITFIAPCGKTKFYDAPQQRSGVLAPLQRKFRDDDVRARCVKSDVRK